MTYNPLPPTGFVSPPTPPRPPTTAFYKRAWFVAIIAFVVGVVLAAAGDKPKTRIRNVAGPTVTVTATETQTQVDTVTATPTVVRTIATRTQTATVTYTPPPPKQYGEGTYVVGTDIQPGTYKTTGGSLCYWARLSSLDTNDIIDNSNSTGPQTVQVQPGDKAFEVDGDCTFGRIG